MIAKYLLIITFLFAGIANTVCWEQPVTLCELVDLALQTHPETRQAWWNAHRASSVLGSAQSAYYPKVDFNANITNGYDYKFINGPDTNYTNVNADLILSMMLYDYGERRAGVNEAKMALIAANWQTNWTLQKIMLRVLENGYALLHAQEVLQAAIISQQDAEKTLQAAQGLNHVGLNSISDVYTSQATLFQMKMEVAEQKALLDIQRGKLAAAIGLTAETPIQLAPLENLPTPQPQQFNQLLALAKCQRADLMVKQARTAGAYARVDKARAAYGPKVSVLGRVGSDHYFHDKAHGAHYQIGLNLDMPLFNGFDTMYQKRIACADVQISLEELAQLELDISLEILTYSRTIEALQEMLCYAKDNLESALKAYEGSLEKYRAGKQRIAEVSNAQFQLAAARVSYSDVKTRWLVTLANLAYATGALGSGLTF